MYVSVTCPHCGQAVAVNCDKQGGLFSTNTTCKNCYKIVYVSYENDSFGFSIKRVS